jgi:hypothetical protein
MDDSGTPLDKGIGAFDFQACPNHQKKIHHINVVLL